MTDSPLLLPADRRVLAALRARTGEAGGKVSFDTLADCVVADAPSLRNNPDLRSAIAAFTERAVDSGELAVPRSRGPWDRSAQPPVPRWVKLADLRTPATAPAPVAWTPALAWAADLRLTALQRERLVAVNWWLRDHPKGPEVPMRERSLGLFGDEKVLEDLINTQLFAPGRLSLRLLRCFPTPPPLHVSDVGEGDTVLVIENSATFHSIRRILSDVSTRPSGCPIAWLAYGAGGLFPAAAASLATLGATHVRYFGDLDARGLLIPTGVPAGAGIPPVRPARALYELLLDTSAIQPLDKLPKEADIRAGCAWLGADLAQRAQAVLRTGRLAQEALGYERLLATPAVLTDLW